MTTAATTHRTAFHYDVAVLGLGYVGIPLAVGFAEAGCRTLGFDVDPKRVAELHSGISPLTTVPSQRIASVVTRELLFFTTDKADLSRSEAIIICVPTPLRTHLDPDIGFILDAGREIAPYLRPGMLVSLESSTYPGTTRQDLCKVLEEGSGLKAGVDFCLSFSPEREDPGNPKSQLSDMPKVVGGITPECLKRAVALYSKAVKRVIPVSSCDTAEAVKLTENIFRFINIALVNELKRIYTAMGIDIWEVIDAAKTKPFGFMPFYPGVGVGGHCIPIDPYYLTWKAREYNVDTRFIQLAGQINRGMPYYAVSRLVDALNTEGKSVQGSHILILGVAYKPDIPDDRESPSYEVMDLLRDKGAVVDYHDPNIPVITAHGGGREWGDKTSIALNAETLRGIDAAIVCTAHRGVDYGFLADHLPLVIDACNVVPKDAKARVIPA
ncbi:MAG: nucleotide sugar dehydrogenase [Proteobacteria bacterium]|nr:nucleotide sugar dehydrogenase [Pseudomonadota bacterium]